MIYYTTSYANVFKITGSVFPHSAKAAVPSAVVAALIRYCINKGYLKFMEADDSILSQTQAWAGFSVLVGFLVIFRSSQAYSRFWDGCTSIHHMRADWFDAASALAAFTDNSKRPAIEISKFKHTLVRLVSMMHSCALMDLEEMNNKWGTTSVVKADTYDLVDPLGLDDQSLQTVYESNCRVMLLFQWVQLLVMRNMEAGVLSAPPPILSRAFHEFAAGMVAFHECVKISDTPFPFPYAQNCELLLVLHWLLVPFVVSQWVSEPVWAFIFVFMQVFVLWSLNFLAEEIENPFGTDTNSIDGKHMQDEMNRHLLLLLHPRTLRTPTISERAVFSESASTELNWDVEHKTFKDIFSRQQRKQRRITLDREDAREAAAKELASDRQRALTVAGQGPAALPPPDGRLRAEAQKPAEPPREPGTKPPPAPGANGSWAIPLQEVKTGGGSWGTDKVYDQPPAPKWDHGTPSWAKSDFGINPPPPKWNHGTPGWARSSPQAVANGQPRPPPTPTARGPAAARDEDGSSGSECESEAAAERKKGARASSRKRKQKSGGRRWL